MKKIFVITGPTASGKTKLSIELAKRINAPVICADSRIVYRELDIVSAKPTLDERQGVEHFLIDIKSINEGVYSAGDFVSDAKKIIDSGDGPVIVQGGTWFYIKSLFDKKELPKVGINQKLRDKLLHYSNEELHDILKSKDSERADKIHVNNRDKIIRSIEIIEGLNSKISDFERDDNVRYNESWFMPDISREEVYKNSDLRVDIMIKYGLYSEWEKLKNKYGRCDILFNTIGYREFFDLEDKVYNSKDEAVDKIKQHTRNFAKRQFTWFNNNIEAFNIKRIKSVEEITV